MAATRQYTKFCIGAFPAKKTGIYYAPMENEPQIEQARIELILDRIDTLAVVLDKFSQDLDRMWVQISSSLEMLDKKIDRLMQTLQDPEQRFMMSSEEEIESKPS